MSRKLRLPYSLAILLLPHHHFHVDIVVYKLGCWLPVASCRFFCDTYISWSMTQGRCVHQISHTNYTVNPLETYCGHQFESGHVILKRTVPCKASNKIFGVLQGRPKNSLHQMCGLGFHLSLLGILLVYTAFWLQLDLLQTLPLLAMLSLFAMLSGYGLLSFQSSSRQKKL